MSNSAVITTKSRDVGIYIHWNGGLESIEAFLNVCKNIDATSPGQDEYSALATLTGVIRIFFGFRRGLFLGILPLNKLNCENVDNCTYVIGGNWEIVERYGSGSTLMQCTNEEIEKSENIFNSIMEKINKSEEK